MTLKLYKEQQSANQQIDAVIVGAIKNHGSFSVPQLILQVTASYPVSEKHVMKRLDLHLRVNDNVVIEEGEFHVKQ